MLQNKPFTNQQKVRRGTLMDSSGHRQQTLESGPTDRREAVKLKSDMKISFDRDSAKYLTGELVKGTVSIALTQEVRIKDLTLKFLGDGRVSWNERRSYFKGSSVTVNLKNTDVFLDQTISILNKASRSSSTKQSRRSTSSSTSSAPEPETDDCLLLPPGLHSFPFQLKLPADLPASTFDAKWGQVRYTVKAVLQRPWKFDIERERDFTLMTSLDLNDEPELARPIACVGEFSPGAVCFRSGQVTTEVRIGRRGYSPGEKITFQVEIENNGRNRLHNHRVALIQHVTFRAKTRVRKLTNCINSLSRGEILPGTSTTWTKDFLTVPAVPPTSSKNYRNIQIKYTFSLFVCHSSWSDEFCLPVTVVIGTSRLKQDTINRYLTMLGCSGPNPRPSPSPSRNASTGELFGGPVNNDSSMRLSSRFLPRNSITVAGEGGLRQSNGSLQLSRRASRSNYSTDNASSTNAIHYSLNRIYDPNESNSTPRTELGLSAASIEAHDRTSSCKVYD